MNINNNFVDKDILKRINGNALKLYIFLGIDSKNETGESWYTLESISQYFGKSIRTISIWIKELEDINLFSLNRVVKA
ncbi:helix-turn-helix domain-containing protein [Clostridium sp. MSJ-11]|uniref:Helix-turn-helix domain-containing protein n=1 Tax=Clostridium mobile TaxID=2841512 RepID=A0ABS6EMT8_9CLOT|nr:helix-turn-helix domain-containing protein [Clostridium mobile]